MRCAACGGLAYEKPQPALRAFVRFFSALALEEFIKRGAMEDVISLFNTVEYDEDYDYKKLRGKR
jgi:hypothetical protein